MMMQTPMLINCPECGWMDEGYCSECGEFDCINCGCNYCGN